MNDGGERSISIPGMTLASTSPAEASLICGTLERHGKRWRWKGSLAAGQKRECLRVPQHIVDYSEAVAVTNKLIEGARAGRLAKGTEKPTISADMTLAAFASYWCTKRDNRSAEDDVRHIERYVLTAPVAAMKLRDIKKAHVLEWICRIPKIAPLATKTIGNIYSTLRACMKAATDGYELIPKNPCRLTKRELPVGSKKPGAKPLPYRTDETDLLCHSERVSAERRVFHSLLLYTGMRHGEAAGRRWKDYDQTAPVLGRLHVHDQYDGQPLKADKGDDTYPRTVPVHPTLAAVLGAWKEKGFAAFYGRKPGPDDFIVPNTGDILKPREVNRSLRRLGEDIARLGIAPRARALHLTRHTFISGCRNNGADADVLKLITHGASKSNSDIIGMYSTIDWETLCRAVMCFRKDGVDPDPEPGSRIVPRAVPAEFGPKKTNQIQGFAGAGDGVRTRDILLGKQVLYQLSYSRDGA